MTKNQNSKNSKNSPRYSWVSTPLPDEGDQLQSSHNSRRSEALRNLQERVPGLRVPNYIDIIDDNENREPEIPASRNAQIVTSMTPKEG